VERWTCSADRAVHTAPRVIRPGRSSRPSTHWPEPARSASSSFTWRTRPRSEAVRAHKVWAPRPSRCGTFMPPQPPTRRAFRPCSQPGRRGSAGRPTLLIGTPRALEAKDALRRAARVVHSVWFRSRDDGSHLAPSRDDLCATLTRPDGYFQVGRGGRPHQLARASAGCPQPASSPSTPTPVA